MHCLFIRFSWSYIRPFCFVSTLQDGYELPSRLAVSAADCFLALSEALIRKAKVLSNKPKLSNTKAQKRQVTLVALDSDDKKEKAASESLDATNLEMEYILWNYLEEILGLVRKLLAVSSIFFICFHLSSTF